MNYKIYHYSQVLKHRLNSLKNYLLGIDNNAILNEINGVIHIGANSGQERDIYQKYDLNVVWVEPIKEIFKQLENNIINYPKQRALNALVTDTKGKEFKFNIASNNGESSSIFNLKGHKDIWPDIDYEKSVIIQSETLPSLIEENSINLKNYEGLFLDTQGSELLILQGSKDLLKNFKFVKSEVADFEAYENCCTLNDLNKFMEENNFSIYSKNRFANRKGGGSYYEVIYKNKNID